MPSPATLRIVGDGRAGGSFARALTAAGWDVELLGRAGLPSAAPPSAAPPVAVPVLLAVPDAAVATVAAEVVAAAPDAVVLHCAGALGLAALAPAAHRGALHPLVSLPDAEVGAGRLRGAWFATAAGDDTAAAVVAALVAAVDGRAFAVADGDRVRYHAAAAVASNHLVALLGQVERLAAGIGVPPAAYLDLARGSLDNVAELGAAAALTGPVARGDWDTVRAHLAALDALDEPVGGSAGAHPAAPAGSEAELYRVLAAAAATLAGRELPADLHTGPLLGDGDAAGPPGRGASGR